MSKRVEKVDVQNFKRPNRARQWLKRTANRTIRRLGKALLEDGPRRIRDVTRGWMY